MKIQQFATVSLEEIISEVFGGEQPAALEDFCDIISNNHTSSDVDVALVLLENVCNNLPLYGVEWRKLCRKYDYLLETTVEHRMREVLEAMIASAPSNVPIYLAL